MDSYADDLNATTVIHPVPLSTFTDVTLSVTVEYLSTMSALPDMYEYFFS